MSSKDWYRQKYANDPKYRRKKLAGGRKYRAAHKDEINARRRKRRKTDAKYRRKDRLQGLKSRLKNIYGISFDDYKTLRKRQRGRCRICRKKKRKLCVDHKRKIVRGLLCHPCNLGLGLLRDDTKRMRRAIAYVKASSPPRRRKRKKARRRRCRA